MRSADAAILLLLGLPSAALAWGHTGHREISRLAMEALPEEVPGFLRTPAAVEEVAELAPELDISKGAGRPHDPDLDPGHYVDLADDGQVFGIVPLDPLPPTREAYDTALRAGGRTQYQAGWLPYTLLGGWQQLRKDFSLWRVAAVGARDAASAEDRAFFAAVLARRERITLHDLGIWSHYVGDATQPMHVSIHFNGWGNYPNPNDYSQDRGLHARFEGAFVQQNIAMAAVQARMAAAAPCDCPVEQRIVRLLRATHAELEPLYRLELTGAFTGPGTPEGVAFVETRLAAGAAELRDLIVEAWRSSASGPAGYPPLETADVIAGRVTLTRESLWRD